MTIALDVEGVIADIHSAWILYYDKPFTKNEITDWDFKNLEKYGESIHTFMKETDYLWRNKPLLIQPSVSNIKRATNQLRPFDIVTSRFVIIGVKKWLDHYRIEYGSIIHVKGNKSRLDEYDVFVDDNPNLAFCLQPNQFLWLIDQPWNQNVRGSKQLHRVSSIKRIAVR